MYLLYYVRTVLFNYGVYCIVAIDSSCTVLYNIQYTLYKKYNSTCIALYIQVDLLPRSLSYPNECDWENYYLKNWVVFFTGEKCKK
jgi:hypothetical protein